MTPFNSNKNAFMSVVQQTQSEFHAFTSSGIPKGTRSGTQQKRSVANAVTAAINAIDTDDFGIRVIVLKIR